MITLHFHLQPQYKYELFHINFTLSHCTGRYELNKLTSLPMCGFIAQLVEHRTGIAEVTGSNPIEALIFFRLLSSCLNWKIYCDDHSSLSSTTAVEIWIISYKLHTVSLYTHVQNIDIAVPSLWSDWQSFKCFFLNFLHYKLCNNSADWRPHDPMAWYWVPSKSINNFHLNKFNIRIDFYNWLTIYCYDISYFLS